MRYENAAQFKGINGYEIDGLWHPRVTKIIDIKSKPGLDDFFKEVGSYSDAEAIKNKSAEEGSMVHSIVEKIAVGEEFEVPENITATISAFKKFKEESGIKFYPEFIEKKVWSVRHRYAGTVDALVSINGKFGVLDIKTSSGFYPEYNLQTAAYVSALQEFSVKKILGLSQDATTRWILRVDQHKTCVLCKATLREKGGRGKVRNGRVNGVSLCSGGSHKWGEVEGVAELREFPFIFKDIKAFIAAKTLWEWENDYWLRQIGYSK